MRNINIDWRRVAVAAAADLSAGKVVGIEAAAVAVGHPAKQAVAADAAKPEVVAAAVALVDTVQIVEDRRSMMGAEAVEIVPAAVSLRPNVGVVVVPSSWRVTVPEKSAQA